MIKIIAGDTLKCIKIATRELLATLYIQLYIVDFIIVYPLDFISDSKKKVFNIFPT
jgi:hypothetical protein